MPDSQNDLDFGQYRIQRLLGRGGMGEVYLARDTALERDVAIKFVSSQKVQDAAARARLLREAQAAAGLDHPCICPVHEAGVTADGRAYIVMPFIDGTPLSEMVQQGALPVRDALTICAQIADALSVAHRHGIVHRDLKPGNVIVSSSGRPRLLDFGLAQSSSIPRAVAEAATVTIAADARGAIVGTPSYMSPEQVQRRPIDGRSDLFSLGAMLYECLTGRRAFDGATPYEAMTGVVHAEPPPPSTIRRELTDRHDALCARLMAKDPNDRFKSADEVLGAIRLLVPDTGRITPSGPQSFSPPPAPIRRRVATGLALVVVACAAALGLWRWSQGTRLPPVPPEADQWYRRGTEALRDGAFQSARLALEHAVAISPQHALAYARLAEADAELDDERAAQTHLLRLSSLVPDESQLSADDQLRVRAVRDSLLRNVDSVVAANQALVNRHPHDAGAWVDLGRAQEAAGLRDDASASFRRAIAEDQEFAAAYLQLGSVEGAALRLDTALEAFATAERLYHAASNAEGETETLLRRGAVLDASGEYKRARIDIERAAGLATSSTNPSQHLRATLTLANITATEGRSSEALAMARSAVSNATANGLEMVAANGLIDLAGTLNDLERYTDSEAQLQRAIEIADAHVARRTAARARIQLAEVRRYQNRNDEAVELVDKVLPFVRNGHYRRLELYALLIQARAELSLGRVQQSRDLSASVLGIAEAIKDAGRLALAASDTAAADTLLGRYLEALQLRQRAEPIYRRQGDQTSLAYALVNEAELLIRLGRTTDADRLLAEVESGAARRLEAYTGRTRRVGFLRLFAAASALQCASVASLAARTPPDASQVDQATVVGPAMVAYCDAKRERGLPKIPAVSGASAAELLDRAIWLSQAWLLSGDATEAVKTAEDGLARLTTPPNRDAQWQLAAVASLAYRALGEQERSTQAAAVAAGALSTLQADWKSEFNVYVSRAELADLRKRAALMADSR